MLAIVGRDLPSSLRVFLLTLAIVDDLGAIILIAILFTAHFAILPLARRRSPRSPCTPLLQQMRFRGWWLYLILGVVAWALLHASGVHATLAGVAIGLATRVRRDRGEHEAPAEKLEHILQPISAGHLRTDLRVHGGRRLAVARVRCARSSTTGPRWRSSPDWWSVRRSASSAGRCSRSGSRSAPLPPGLSWRDLFAVSVLTGCGFTVSLLIAELAFDGSSAHRRGSRSRFWPAR